MGEFQLREKLLPRVNDLQRSVRESAAVNLTLGQDLKEIHSRVDQEEKARALIEQRVTKTLDAALLPLQRSIEDEGNLRQTSFSGIQSAIRALRVDMEADTAGRFKQIDGFKRLLAQRKEEADKERAEIVVAHDFLERNTQEFFRNMERFKQERISSEETLRKLVLEEERMRTSQTLGMQESLKTVRHDLESEARATKQAIETRVRHWRQYDDELLHRVNECVASATHERNNREAFETAITQELNDWKQLYHGVKKDMKELMQQGLQVFVTKLSDQMTQIQVPLQKEIRDCKLKYDGLEQRITSLVQVGVGSGENGRVHHAIEDEFETSLRNAWQSVAEGARRDVSDELLSQQIKPTFMALESPNFVFTSAAIEHPQQKDETQPKFDLLEEVRVLAQKHLEGNISIWGGVSQSPRMWSIDVAIASLQKKYL